MLDFDRDVGNLSSLLDLIERRFDIRLEPGSVSHLREVSAHYAERRELMLMCEGAAATLSNPDYAKALLISEAAKLMILREIDPRPRRKKKKK